MKLGKAVSNIRAIYYPFFSVTTWVSWQKKPRIESVMSDYIPNHKYTHFRRGKINFDQ